MSGPAYTTFRPNTRPEGPRRAFVALETTLHPRPRDGLCDAVSNTSSLSVQSGRRAVPYPPNTSSD